MAGQRAKDSSRLSDIPEVGTLSGMPRFQSLHQPRIVIERGKRRICELTFFVLHVANSTALLVSSVTPQD